MGIFRELSIWAGFVVPITCIVTAVLTQLAKRSLRMEMEPIKYSGQKDLKPPH